MSRILPTVLLIVALVMLIPQTVRSAPNAAGQSPQACASDSGCEHHPSASSAVALVANDKAKLPEGHPAMPEGHPQMPAGHPSTEKAVSPSPFNGSLVIKAVQGTKDGPVPGNDSVQVEFYAHEKIVHTLQGKIDANGVLMFDNIKLPGPVQPLVTITHAGVPCRTLGSPMSADQPDQIVRVNVYETTTTAPDWQVTMRHIMIKRTDKGLLVNEVLVIHTPGDRTWIGSKDSPATLVIPLPANRTETILGPGLQDEQVKIEDHRVIDCLPLSPGNIQVQIAYVIPVNAGQASLQITAPAAVKHMVLFAPDDGSTITSVGLQADKSMKSGRQAVRMFSAQNLPAKQNVSLVFKGLAEPAKAGTNAGPSNPYSDDPTAAATASGDGGSSGGASGERRGDVAGGAQLIAGVGAGVLSAAVVMVLMVKGPRRPNKALAV